MGAKEPFVSARTVAVPTAGAVAKGADLAVDDILDGLAEGFFALDSCWRFVAFNRAAEEIFDLRREDVIGRTIWDVSPATLGAEFERRYRLVMTKREKQVFECYSARRPDRYYEICAFPLTDGIGVAFRDVTERQAIVETLRRREIELGVQRIGGVGGMWVDVRHDLAARRSPEYLQIYGLPPEATRESHDEWVQRLHPDDRAGAIERLFAAVAGAGDEYKSKYRVIRPSDGAVRRIRAVAEIERDADGEATALVGAHIDITDGRLAEQEVVESEERLRAIADALPVLISYVDSDQVFRFVEDDDGVRAFATEALRELGYRVAEASSGKAALSALDGAPNLDLLLTDVVMPGDCNGRELAEEAQRRRPGLRVLCMTGYSRDVIMSDGRLDPGVHVLGKPFSLEELAEKVP